MIKNNKSISSQQMDCLIFSSLFLNYPRVIFFLYTDIYVCKLKLRLQIIYSYTECKVVASDWMKC